MGTWSYEPFGNDTAGDWAYGLDENPDLSYLQDAFEKVLANGEEYLEAPDAEEAIAAAEVLAKVLGRGTQTDAYTESVDRWVGNLKSTPSAELRRKASEALLRVMAEDSEITELWSEAEGAKEWRASIDRLRAAIEV